MSSLLTNNSAMVALQTLKTINKNMSEVQNEISTGKRIATARDNAALWGISATMRTDVSGFRAISESLSLGTATLSVGRDAAEAVTGLLDQLKGRVVAAQEENIDRNKVQADVDALRNQIVSVVNAAQFNGLNLLGGYEEVSILASLNRDDSGNVTSSSITFTQKDLTTKAGVFGTGASLAANITSTTPNNGTPNTASFTVTAAATGAGIGRLRIAGVDVVADVPVGAVGVVAAAFVGAINDNPQLRELGVSATNTGGTVTVQSVNPFEDLAIGNASTTAAGAAIGTTSPATLVKRAQAVTFLAVPVAEGDSYRVTIGSINYDYIAGDNETMSDVALGLARLVNSDPAALKIKIAAKADLSGATPVLYIDNGSGSPVTMADDGAAGGTRAGGLRGLEAIDVTTEDGAKAALAALEGFIQTAIKAAAHFGSAQGRIETQESFVGKIMDGLTSGIGALVDADMEAASARLQALQVQQQLGIQALSIANQQPQNILALFRQ